VTALTKIVDHILKEMDQGNYTGVLIQVYEDVFSSQILELTQLSNFSVDAFKLEFLMMRSATEYFENVSYCYLRVVNPHFQLKSLYWKLSFKT
jgi:hypothetical protein